MTKVMPKCVNDMVTGELGKRPTVAEDVSLNHLVRVQSRIQPGAASGLVSGGSDQHELLSAQFYRRSTSALGSTNVFLAEQKNVDFSC